MYPAITVLEALKTETSDLLWVGRSKGIEADLIKRENLPYASIPAAGIHGVGIKKLSGNMIKLIKGYFASKKILREFNPDVLFFTGGYLAIPMAMAGRKTPSVLFVPDIEPSLALKFLALFAKRIALTNQESASFFADKEKLTVTGYPIRQGLTRWTKQAGREYFDLVNDQPVLLFVGGSSGARSINNALLSILPDLLKQYQVIHLTGHLDWEDIQQRTASMGSNYHTFPYLHEIGAALAAADLVISRSGASTLGEYPFFSLPAILVPYPYAWRYQKVNADYLVNHGAAIMLLDETLQETLMPTIKKLFENKHQLAAMKHAMSALEESQAAIEISELIREVAEV